MKTDPPQTWALISLTFKSCLMFVYLFFCLFPRVCISVLASLCMRVCGDTRTRGCMYVFVLVEI